MKISKITLCILLILFLSACSSTPNKKSSEIANNIQSQQDYNNYYVFREKAFGGAAATVVVHCNNDQYRLGVGDFVMCPPSEKLNFISANAGNGLYFTEILENNNNVLNSGQSKIYLRENSDSKFFLLSTSILSDAGLGLDTPITQKEAISLIKNGYDYVEIPSSKNSILRSTTIMNPFTDFDYGLLFKDNKLPPYMQLADNKKIDQNKQGVIVYTEGAVSNHTFGIWTKEGFKGSLVSNSFIFIQSDNPQEKIYTYYGGKLTSLDVLLEEGKPTFVSLDTSIGWSSHNRNVNISNIDNFELRLPYLDYLNYDREAETPVPMSIIEQEGLKILNSLVPEL